MNGNRNDNILLPRPETSQTGNIPDKGYPCSGGDTEVDRLAKIIEEKDVLIERLKKESDGRKEDLDRLQGSHDSMKEFTDSFCEELKKICADGELNENEYGQITKLYGQWYIYKKNCQLYKGKLKGGRSCVHDIKDDLDKLEALLPEVVTIAAMRKMTDRIFIMRQHLEILQGKLLI